MAKGRVVKSAIDAALGTVKSASKAADEIVESAGKSAGRASMIKNCVNSVQSNMSAGQAKAVANAGGDGARVFKEGINTALEQTKANTAQKALNRTARQGNSAVQKSKEFIDAKRVNQVIDGHNARSKQTAIDTIANNVKDSSINRVPKDHETARNAVNKANETVRNARNTQNQNTANTIFNAEYGNNWRENAFHGKPVVGYNRDTYQMHTQTGSQASPFLVNNRKLQNEVEYYNNRRTLDNTGYGPTKATAESMNKIGGNTTGGSTQQRQTSSDSNKVKERINRTFDKVPESVKDTFIGGISDSYKNYQSGMGIMESISKAHQNDDGSLNIRRAAGTFMAASAAARIASGGGLYKDRYGNPNLIGVPFI